MEFDRLPLEGRIYLPDGRESAMSQLVRKECLRCEAHTFRDQCGNCGSTVLRPVSPGRFERMRTAAAARQPTGVAPTAQR